MNLLAHLTDIDGLRTEQSLKEHCFHTAEYASQSVGNPKLYHTVYLAGLLHDCGKSRVKYLNYIEDAYEGKDVIRGSVNHTFAGVIYLLEKYHSDKTSIWERLTSEIISYAVGSHHGIFDCTDLEGKNGFLHRLQKDREELDYDETIHNYLTQVADENLIEDLFQKAVQEIKSFFQTATTIYGKNSGSKIFFQISMLVRLILSAVIYGDRRDTSEFMEFGNVHKALDEQKRGWEERLVYFDEKISGLDTSSALNQVRNDISMQCLTAAQMESGIYRLNVPTGAGKTLSSLRYALAHAKKYNKKRIIFIIPLLSVLDQNAKVIRDHVQDQDEVLEHHSNVIREENTSEEADRYEFLEESWNYPIVVSTLVQLLDILFSNRTSAIGRMQALCDSVIVIDEVQSLPKKITYMFNMAMNFLQKFCNASIVLSSATQPCFEELKWPLHLAEKSDIVKLSPDQLRIFQRADIVNKTDPYGMSWSECVNFCTKLMNESSSLLVICNTKSEARTLFEKLCGRAKDEGWHIYHLSTSMCQAHRLFVLSNIKKKLEKLNQKNSDNVVPNKVLCISTQLIEAGVDISFENVVRVLAGIDNLAQSAGRCNRSGEYGSKGKVYLINLKNEKLNFLKEIKIAQDCTRKVLEFSNTEAGNGLRDSLIGDEATKYFYHNLYKEIKSVVRYPAKIDKYSPTYYLADLLSNMNAKAKTEGGYVLHQPFKTIGEEFKVFDEETIDIIVPYGLGKDLIAELEAMQNMKFHLEKFKVTIQKTKPYSISIYAWQRKILEETGMLHSIFDRRALVLSEQAYDKDYYGLRVETEQPVSEFVL